MQDVSSTVMLIELRTDFYDPDGELVGVLERPAWQRITRSRQREVVDELVRVCEERGLWEADAWVQPAGVRPQHIIGYWHPPNMRRRHARARGHGRAP